MNEERVFAEPWEAQAFALAVALNERGLFTWPEWASAFAAVPEESGATTSAGWRRSSGS